MERKKEFLIILIIVIIAFSIIIFNMQNKNFHSNITHLPPPSPDTIVVAFISDAKPALGKNVENLIEDFNQIKLQSPGNLKAIVAIGDMNPLNNGKVNTDIAFNSSIVKNIPLFYVIGNHELLNI